MWFIKEIDKREVIKLEFILKLKIMHYDWLLICPDAANHCALFITSKPMITIAHPGELKNSSTHREEFQHLSHGLTELVQTNLKQDTHYYLKFDRMVVKF